LNTKTLERILDVDKYSQDPFVRWKKHTFFDQFHHQGQSSSTPSVSTTCISQSKCLWILDLGASSHIFGNLSSFLFVSSPKVSHLVNVTSGSKVTSEGIG